MSNIGKMFLAARLNDISIAAECLKGEPDFDLNVENDHGNTLLSTCIENGNFEIAHFFINKGIDINQRSGSNLCTPLHLCVLTSHPNKGYEIMKELLKAGALPNVQSFGGYTPLQFACIMNSRIDQIKLLLENHADVNIINDKGDNALHCAMLVHGDIAVVKLLVDAGIDMYLKNKKQNTPLAIAKEYKHFRAAQYLERYI